MSATTLPKGRRFLSYSWAELGAFFRAARLAGNEALAARLKQAIDIKKHLAEQRRG